MADYYVDGDAATNGDGSEISPWNTIAAAMAGSADNDTIHITGAFTGEQLTGKSGQTWIKWGSSPTITNTTAHVSIPVADCLYDGLILDGGDQSTYHVILLTSNVTGWEYTNCTLKGGDRIVSTNNGTGSITNSTIYGNINVTATVQIEGGIWTFWGNTFLSCRYPVSTGGVCVNIAGGTVVITQNVFAGTYAESIQYKRDTVTAITIQNNIIVGWGQKKTANTYGIKGTGVAGAITETISHNYISAMGKDPSLSVSGPTPTDTVTGDIKLTGIGPGYFSVVIDDYADVNKTYYTALAAKAAELQMPVVHALSSIGGMDADDFAYLNGLGATGNGYYKFGNHSTWHTLLAETNYPYVFYFDTYPAGATVEFDGTTLTLTSDGSTEVYSEDVSAMTYTALETALNALAGFNITKHSNTNNNMLCKVLESTSEAAISTLTTGQMPADFGAVNSRYYDHVIAEAQTILTANINSEYLQNTLYYPGGSHDATLAAWLEANTTYNLGYGIGTRTNSADFISGFRPYEVFRIAHDDFVGANDTETRNNIRATALMLAATNGAMGFYAHNDSEFTIAQFEILAEVMRENNVTLVDHDGLEEYVMGHDYDETEGWYYREYPAEVRPKLIRGSVAIDAGTWITGVNDQGYADPWGKYVHRLPNIGADQGAGTPIRRYMLMIGG